MTRTVRHRLAGLALALAVACDSGFFIDANVTVPAEVAGAYSETDRGLLIVRFDVEGYSHEVQALGIVCGGDEFTWESGDRGLGDLPDSTIQAWIEPLSPGDTRPCGAFDEPDFEVASLAPDPDEPQDVASLAEAHGCGNDHATVALTLAPPEP